MKFGEVYLVGAGPGDPLLLTLKADYILKKADCIIYDYLANPIIIDRYDCEKIYVGKQGSHHTLKQEDINALIIKKAKEGNLVVRLKGGDPFIFGRGGEEAEELIKENIVFKIIPGISSFYSAPAYAGIPLTHRDFSNALEVISGHRRSDALPDEDVNFPEYLSDRTYTFLMGVSNLAHIVSKLIGEKNFPEDTGVALISWGTRPDQKTLVGTLKNIVELVKKEKLKPPAIIVVGNVVRLREKLRWYDNQPLFGKKIVVTRTRKQASKMVFELLTRGANVVEFPTIEIETILNNNLADSIQNIEQYDWLFFTSQNAVNIFFEELFSLKKDARALANIKIAVIGIATAKELFKYGIIPDVVPDEFVAESLLKSMELFDLTDSKIFLPCSEQARFVLKDGLEGLGAIVDRVHIYRAVKPRENNKLDLISDADMITFTSSSTVENFFDMVDNVNCELASIGPITSDKIRSYKKEPVIN